MNTHLHILEAYTNLYTVWSDKDLKTQLENLIEVMLDRFVAPNNHFNLFFARDWTLLSHEISYGHDIEGSWLLTEAALVVNDRSLIARVEKVAIRMLEASLEGLDVDGGLMNAGDVNGITDSTKHWWPQAEALVGLVNGYQLTGDEKYLQSVQRVWDFINERLIDKENGEWHWKVSKQGNQDYSEDKAGPWKCPYHNGRAMIELMHRLQ
jgi:mannobiose 2-epimerase